MRRFATIGFLTLLIASGAALGLRMLRRAYLPLPMDRCTKTAFDGRVWRDTLAVFTEAAPRGCMVDDLLARHSLIGQPRAAVLTQLGDPGPSVYFRDYDLVYWLGPERGLISIDSEWLVLRLDSTGRVTEQRLVTD